MITPRICFLHVPKTGGTSFATQLDDHFSIDRICSYNFQHELDQVDVVNLKSYQLFHGHFLYACVTKLLDSVDYITLLREPVARVISSYKHFKRIPECQHERDIYQGWHLPSGEMVKRVSNLQVYYLSSFDLHDDRYSLSNHLESAKENLEHFSVVGVLENLPEMMRQLTIKYGWVYPQSFRQLNVAPSITDLHHLKTEEIRELNWADIDLYDYVVRLTINAAKSATIEDLLANYVWGFRQRHPEQLERLHYTFDQPLDGDGWHQREGAGTPHPQIWRWTGPGTLSYIDLPIVPCRNYLLSFRVVNTLSDEIRQSLSVLINGKPTKQLKHRHDGLWGTIFSTEIRSEHFIEILPFTRVAFRVVKVLKQVDVDPVIDDQRPCGVAITEIWVE